MLKSILRFFKEYETVENNSQRLNKGFKKSNMFSRLWKLFYE